ncbi:MAG: hypothetical protein PHS19_03550 [Eubacteriales bacterium]|nr:hypothetical protein [Eubacteriales bacterium]
MEFLVKQGYEINTVTEYGIINQKTTDIDRTLGLVRNEDGTLSSTKSIHVDRRLATHADIYMCQLGLWSEAGIFVGDPEKLGPKYPDDIIYNAVCTRDYFLHMIEKTDPELMEAFFAWRRSLNPESRPGSSDIPHDNTRVLGVRQGYTRCMCLPVDNESFIVSDEGLSRPLETHGAKVLLIEQGHIKLNGFKYGFIGGTAGNIYINSDGMKDQRAIVFNGDLSVHPDFKKITGFIKSRNILPVWFENYALEDIGSIIAIE